MFVLLILFCILRESVTAQDDEINETTVLAGCNATVEWQINAEYDIKTALLSKEGKILLRLDSPQTENEDGRYLFQIICRVNSCCVSLTIYDVLFSDATNYSFMIYSVHEVTKEKHVRLYVQGYPTLHVPSSKAGDISSATCCFNTSRKTNHGDVTWFLCDESVSQKFIYLDVSKTDINLPLNVTRHCETISYVNSRKLNKKTLTCWISNCLNLSAPGTLDVLYPPEVNITSDYPEVPGKVSIMEYRDVFLICKTDSNPEANVTLQKYGEENEIHRKENFFEILRNNSVWIFPFRNITRSFIGFYKCEAINEVGHSVSSKLFVDVTFRPTVYMITDDRVLFMLYDNVSIECRTHSNPPAEVKLQQLLHGEWVNLTVEAKIETNYVKHEMISKLTLVRIQENHSGRYRCIAGNSIGNPAWSTEVTLFQSGGFHFPSTHLLVITASITAPFILLAFYMSVSFYRKKSQLNISGIRRVRYLQPSRRRMTYSYPDVVTLGCITDDGASTSYGKRSMKHLEKGKLENHDMTMKSDSDTTCSDPVYIQCDRSTLNSDGKLSFASVSHEFLDAARGSRVRIDSSGYALLNEETMCNILKPRQDQHNI